MLEISHQTLVKVIESSILLELGSLFNPVMVTRLFNETDLASETLGNTELTGNLKY